MNYTLEFEDYKENRTVICSFSSETKEDAINKAIRKINKLEKEKGRKVYYIRTWGNDEQTVFDYGSHSEFYYLKANCTARD